ncbi:MAG: hypothetical protein R3B93_18760 [Bacteroidia bacterium]
MKSFSIPILLSIILLSCSRSANMGGSSMSGTIEKGESVTLNVDILNDLQNGQIIADAKFRIF